MIALLQRVSDAKVIVSNREIASIGRGLLVLLAVESADTKRNADRMAERILSYRVFPDRADKMNLSVLDEGLDVLLVPQFTLAADTKRGTRPSFSNAAAPEAGAKHFTYVLEACRAQLPGTQSGEFGAHMLVSLTNDGPVTLWLQS